MTSEPTLTEERMMADLGAEVRSLTGVIRASLADLMFAPGREIATRFLAVAPADACVRLADAWAVAELVGLPVHDLKAALSAEEQFLVETVTAVYAGGTTARGPLFAALPAWARLGDEVVHELCGTP